MMKFLLTSLIIGSMAAIGMADSYFYDSEAQRTEMHEDREAAVTTFEQENPGLMVYYTNRAQTLKSAAVPSLQQSGEECPPELTKEDIQEESERRAWIHRESDTY